MPNTPEVELLKEAGELAKRNLLDMAQAMYGVVMGTDGETFGDSQLDRGDRIARFMSDAQSGALDVLRVQSPTIYRQYVAQYVRDINDSPLVKGGV